MRRAPGTGRIRKLPSGSYQILLTIEGKEKALGAYATPEIASDMLDAMRNEVANGARSTDVDTLGPYMREKLTELEKGGRRGMRSVWTPFAKHIESHPIASTPIVELRRPALIKWFKHIRKTLGPGSARNVIGWVRQCLEHAVDEEIIAMNPATFRRRRGEKSAKETDTAWTYLTPAEQETLRTSPILGDEQRLILLSLMYLGLRVGELCALRLADVHLDGDLPHVTVRYGSTPHGPTKTGRARHVPISPLAADVLRQWFALLPTVAKRNPHGLAFPAKRGGFRTPGGVIGNPNHFESQPRHSLRELLLPKAKRPDGRRARIHDLRHTCASSMIAGWWGEAMSLETVQEVLGHTSISMTRRYVHLAPSVVGARIGLLNGSLNGSGFTKRPAASGSGDVPRSSRWRTDNSAISTGYAEKDALIRARSVRAAIVAALEGFAARDPLAVTAGLDALSDFEAVNELTMALGRARADGAHQPDAIVAALEICLRALAVETDAVRASR